MIGPYPRSPHRIDGGVSAAMTYLSQALVEQQGIELIGVRVGGSPVASQQNGQFAWTVVDLPLGRLSLSTLYRKQKAQFRELIERYKPDVVHGQGVDVEGFLAVRSEKPAVVTVHGILGACVKYKDTLTARLRARLTALVTEFPTVRSAMNLIAISPYITQYYKSEMRGRIHDIPNAVAPSFFAVKREPEPGRLLFAGRITRGKGVLELLNAVASSREAVSKVVLAGSAPEPAYEFIVRKEIERLGLDNKVERAGLLDEPALCRELSRASALILPSYQETAPMVVQQAMAAGVAVIATSVGGIPFQIQHGVSGLLFEAGNAAELASLMRRLAENPSLRLRLGESAKLAAKERYEAHEVAAATRAVYEAALGSDRTHS